MNVLTAEILSGQLDDEGDPIDDLSQSDYPNQLLTGTICKWMQSAYPSLQAAKATIYSNISYIYPDEPDEESTLAMKYFGPQGGSLPGWNNAVEVDFNIKATNAVQQTYAMLSDYTAAEAPPTGMAAVLYSALSVLQYEGTWNAISNEVAPTTSLGTVLNLSGGRAEWAAMNALVQVITDDLDNGTTTYKIGPAEHLTIQDLMEQLRATRKRTLSSKIKERQTGQPDSDVVNGAGHTHHSSGGSPPTPTNYPWIDFIDEADDGDGNPETWDALLGYGQSSFAGSDEIDHAGPLESLEISVGNDGSDWTAADGSHIDAQDSLTNSFSLISGDQNNGNDQLLIARVDSPGGGSIKLKPYAPSIHLSTNMDPDDDEGDDPFIHIDLQSMLIAMQDEDGAYINLDLSDLPIIELNDAGGGSSSLGVDSLDLAGDSGSSASLNVTGEPELQMTSADGKNCALYPDNLQLYDTSGAMGLSTHELSMIAADGSTAIVNVGGESAFVKLAYGSYSIIINTSGLPANATMQQVLFLAPPIEEGGPGIPSSMFCLCTTPATG